MVSMCINYYIYNIILNSSQERCYNAWNIKQSPDKQDNGI